VTIDTLKEILQQQKAVYQSLPSPLGKNYTVAAQDYVSFQLQTVKSLNQRSKSNHARLKTEITLVMKSSTTFILSMHVLPIEAH
jgi:hypothetical protein